MSEEPKLSGAEKIKAASNYLRGNISEELANAETSFTEDTAQVLKFHGMYQQDDRDLRGAKDAQGNRLGKAYSLMVRLKLPGGRMTAEQFLTQLDLCDQWGNGTLRLTDRQCIQFHGVLKRDIKAAMRRINEAQITTLGACGDVERNVLCCPACYGNDPVREQIYRTADHLARHLLPRTTAYHEIWLTDLETGEKQLAGGGEEGHVVEPLYGPTYLPRKFKTAIAMPEDNCIDLHANDLGLLAIHDGQSIAGYNVLVGGGFGVTPSNKNTFPAVARPLAYIDVDDVVAIAEAIIRVQRDFGDRVNRKRSRMKYLIADWGMERFRAKVEEYFGRPLAQPKPVEVEGFDDHIGWHEQGDGRWFYGLNVENGRVADRDGFRLKTALREACLRYRPTIRITAHQSLLLGNLGEEDREPLEQLFRAHGLKLDDELSTVRRWSMACVAMPTCPLAVTESERVMPQLMEQFEAELERLGLANERFTVRMTGCPNGCSRPYNADIGLVGKTAGKYTVFLGGRVLGDRLNYIYKDLVPFAEIVPTLTPVFEYFKRDRLDGETLGDFCHRKGRDALLAASQGAAAPSPAIQADQKPRPAVARSAHG